MLYVDRCGVCVKVAFLVSSIPSDHLYPQHNKKSSAGPQDARVASIVLLTINVGFFRLENISEGSDRSWSRPHAVQPPRRWFQSSQKRTRLSHQDLPASQTRWSRAASFVTITSSKVPEYIVVVKAWFYIRPLACMLCVIRSGVCVKLAFLAFSAPCNHLYPLHNNHQPTLKTRAWQASPFLQFMTAFFDLKY